MVAHRPRPVFVVPHAEHEPVVVQQLGMPFEVGIGAVVERVSGALRPLDEVALPAVEQPGQRPVEGDAMPLQAAAAVIAVEAVAAPVVVGVVGIGRQLQEDARVGRASGTDDEEAPALGGAPSPAHELAALVPGAQRELVVAAAPEGRHLQRVGNRPAAAIGGGVFRHRMGRSGQLVLPPHHFAPGTDPRHFQLILLRAGGHVKAHLLAGPVAELIGIALDEHYSGYSTFIRRSRTHLPPHRSTREFLDCAVK